MDNYVEYVNSFKKLDIDTKQRIIIDNVEELLNLLENIGKTYDINSSRLPVMELNDNYDSFLDSLFTYVISLKEVNADIINLLLDNIGDKNE